jgi:hypothetical protein
VLLKELARLVEKGGGLGLHRSTPTGDMLADDWPDEAGRAAYLAGAEAR